MIDAYILEEIQLQATTPAAEQPSSGSSTVLHPKSPGLSPMSPTTNLLNPLPMPLADDDTGKLDEDAPQDAADAEQAPEQDATSRGIGDRLSPTDIISTLSPELRFNAMAMVCAVAAPSLALHKKLRRQALREGDLPRVPDTRQEYIERKEAAEDTLALGGDALTNDSIAALDHHAAPLDEAPSDTCESEENKSSPNDVGKASRSKIQETAQAGPQILMASPNSVEQKESTSSWTFSGLKRAGNWVGGRGWGSDSPESTPSAAAKGLGIGMSPTADKSPTAEARKWSWGITAITASQSEEPGSPESPSKSRWGSWMRWNTEQSALQEPAVDKDESLLWHTEYVKFLSGFMVVDDGRASTLSSILNSKEKCSPFAAYILERATEFEKAEPHKKDLQVVDESMPKTGRTTSIVPECAAPESNESESEDDAEMDEVERTIKRVNKYEEKLKMLRSPKFNPMGRRMSLSLLDPDTLKPIKIPQMTSADEGKGGGGAVDEVPKLEKELSGDHAELEKQLCGAAICTPCTPGVQRQPWTICWLILAASVGSRSYDARSRSVIRHLSRHLLVPWQWIRSAEIAFCKEIIKATAPPPAEVKESEERYWNKNRMMRYGLIGGGAVAGGVVLAVTGGLAAPAIVAGLGLAGAAVAGAGVVGAGAASFAASVAAFGGLSTALGVSFGAAGAGLLLSLSDHHFFVCPCFHCLYIHINVCMCAFACACACVCVSKILYDLHGTDGQVLLATSCIDVLETFGSLSLSSLIVVLVCP